MKKDERGERRGRVASVRVCVSEWVRKRPSLSIFIHTQYTSLAFLSEMAMGSDASRFRTKAMPNRPESKRWTQTFWCTFPPSPLFVLLRFPLHTHWVLAFHPFHPLFSHTHTYKFFSFLSLCLGMLLLRVARVCVSFIYLFFSIYLKLKCFYSSSM